MLRKIITLVIVIPYYPIYIIGMWLTRGYRYTFIGSTLYYFYEAYEILIDEDNQIRKNRILYYWYNKKHG